MLAARQPKGPVMRLLPVLPAYILALAPAAHALQETPEVVPPEPGEEIVTPEEVIETTPAALDREDLAAWLDGFMTYALPRNGIAGAVVVVVRDGEVLLQEGYGYADVEEEKPVDPETTLFRPGSVSKLVTWTAVMQLVEQGLVDLDTDVNDYIDFEIPARHGVPLTLRDIMTHTPGFEEQVKGLITTGEPRPMGEHLKDWVPEQIFPPGETPAYSNYATALAGYVVEQVSGMSFDDYVDERIFEPLGMSHSTFRQPLPERLEEHMSRGYKLASEPPKPFEIIGGLAPAGSMSASGADMGRFMLAHLGEGAWRGARILEPETAELMHGTPRTFLPRVNRMMLGFYETNYNGHRVIAHGGDTGWFHSYLHLFVDEGVGLFVSFNSAGKEGATNGLRMTLFHEFTNRYFPGEGPEGTVDEDTAAEHARMIAGTYDNSRRIDTSFLSILNLFGQVKVVPNGDGTISVPLMRDLAGEPVRWREIAPLVWKQEGGKDLLAAQVEDGRVVRFSFDMLSPFMVFEPTPAWRLGTWLAPALFAAFAVFALSTLAWPSAALIRRYYGAAYGLAGREAKAHRLVRAAALAVLILLAAWGVTVTTMMSDFDLLSSALDPWIWTLQLLSLVVFAGAAVIGLWNARVVLAGGRRKTAKAWSVILALSFLVVLWVALVFELIAFDVNY